jgi:hypothetical protein
MEWLEHFGDLQTKNQNGWNQCTQLARACKPIELRYLSFAHADSGILDGDSYTHLLLF